MRCIATAEDKERQDRRAAYLEENDRRLELVYRMDWRSLPVYVLFLRVWPYQPIQIPRLEFVGFLCQQLTIGDAIQRSSSREHISADQHSSVNLEYRPADNTFYSSLRMVP